MKDYFVWLAKFITIVVVFLFIVPALLIGVVGGVGKVAKKGVSMSSANKVAVIELEGVIQDTKKTLKELHKYVDDASIDGIVLRINSPGGAVGPSQDIYSAVAKLKEQKPIIASMGTVAASGGLYSALSASKIFAQPGTLTGSIGVIMQVPNFTKVADRFGVDMITIKSGKYKDVGNSFREMTAEDRAFMQDTIDTVQGDFVDAVVSGRGLARKEVLKFADGRLIVGSQALEYKLIDKFGGLYDAAREVYEVLGKPLKANQRPKLVYTDQKFEKFKKFLESVIDLPIRLISGSQPSARLMYL